LGKRLVITEKPSVARDICEVLGGFEDHGDYQESADFVVTFALGHLLELAEPQDYDKTLRAWTIASLPIIPESYRIKPKDGQKKRLDLIRKLGRRDDVDSVVNACDAGREGEIIFRRIVEYTGLDSLPQERLWLRSMTADAIRDGFDHLAPGARYDHLADAAWLRGVGDWLVGMNATRALTKRLKGRSERGAWSAGRVQTPTLGLLVAREREILAHEPRTYWEIVATFSHGAGAAAQTWEGRFYDAALSGHPDRDVRPTRLFDRARVDAVLTGVVAAIGREPPVGVAEEKRKKSKQAPPLPFDLTTLQREANRRFSFSARRSLNAAQRLYEQHKLLTYPRTDSRYLPGDYGPTVTKVLDALAVDADYQALASGIVEAGPLNLDKILDDAKVSDHFAIVPTGAEPPADLSGDDARIYDLVVRQFLASLMGPATWATVERHVTVPLGADDSAVFRTTARALEVPGFLEALGQEEGAGSQLAPLAPGQDEVEGVAVATDAVADEEKLTRPPSRYTDAALLRLMETAGERIDDDELADVMKGRGLGTPATRADIIERLVQTGYARRVDSKLGPTPKGIRLLDVLERAKAPVLASAALTGQWEYALQQVQEGQVPRDEALQRLEAFTRDLTASLANFDHDAIFGVDAPLGPCPSCKVGEVVESAWGYRCTRNVQGSDACKFILWKDRGGRYIDRKTAEQLVRKHVAGPLEGFVDRFGRSLTGTIRLEPDEDVPGAQWTMNVSFGDLADPEAGPEERLGMVFPCPCGNEACEGVLETSERFVCQLVFDKVEKKGPQLPKIVCQRPMDIEEVGGFFAEEGRTDFIDGFTSRRGRPFRGMLVRKPTGKHGFEFPPRAGASAEDGAEAAAPRGRRGAAAKATTTEKAAPAKKAAAKKAAPKKAAAKKAASSEVAASDASAPPKKAAAKRAAPKKPAAKKAAPKKATAKKASGSGGDEAANDPSAAPKRRSRHAPAAEDGAAS
jgi:DNA topoisomerase-3